MDAELKDLIEFIAYLAFLVIILGPWGRREDEP